MLNKILIIAVMFFLMLLAGSTQAGGDAARGAELAQECADCHGQDGKGDEDIPGIAGLDAATHVKFLKAFKSGERSSEDDVMQEYSADLTDQEMADVAAYYASLPAN
ncbi:MAG: c-type cytochrome [Xanthomonadales bacterium]|nr:c-type cytochrome [Xanthomonadales bacterium]